MSHNRLLDTSAQLRLQRATTLPRMRGRISEHAALQARKQPNGLRAALVATPSGVCSLGGITGIMSCNAHSNLDQRGGLWLFCHANDVLCAPWAMATPASLAARATGACTCPSPPSDIRARINGSAASSVAIVGGCWGLCGPA